MNCNICYESFDVNQREPLLMACGHTVCKACSTRIQVCPWDKVAVRARNFVKNFQILQEVSNLDMERSPSLQRCRWHGEQIKMTCITDGESICFRCLLYEHKDHEVKEAADYHKETDEIRKALRDKRGVINMAEAFIADEEFGLYVTLLDEEKAKMKQKIETLANNITRLISSNAAKMLDQLNDVFSMFEKIAQQQVAEKQRLLDLYRDDLKEFVNLTGFWENTNAVNLDKEFFRNKKVAEELLPKVSLFEGKFQRLKERLKPESFASDCAKLMRYTITLNPLLNESVSSAIFSQMDLFNDDSALGVGTRTQYLKLRTCGNVSADDISFLVGACVEPRRFAMICRENFTDYSEIVLEFESQALAKRFFFLNEMSMHGHSIEMSFIEHHPFQSGMGLEYYRTHSDFTGHSPRQQLLQRLKYLEHGNRKIIDWLSSTELRFKDDEFQGVFYIGQVLKAISQYLSH